MRTLAAACLLLLSACSPDLVVSPSGIRNYFGEVAPVPAERLGAMEAQLVGDLAGYGYPAYSAKYFRGLTVQWHPKPWECVGGTKPARMCAGSQDGETINLAAKACPEASAYRHELLHWLHGVYGMPTDYDHQLPEWVVTRTGNDCKTPLQPIAAP